MTDNAPVSGHTPDLARELYLTDWPPSDGKETDWSLHWRDGNPDAAARRYIAMAETAGRVSQSDNTRLIAENDRLSDLVEHQAREFVNLGASKDAEIATLNARIETLTGALEKVKSVSYKQSLPYEFAQTALKDTALEARSARNTRTAADRTPSEAQVRDGVLDDAIRVCREQEEAFLDPQYAHPQPMGSFSERFACSEIIRALEALKSPATTSKEGG